MKLYRRNQGAIAQQAAEWTEILKTAGARERAAFDEWLMESPRHVREFLLMTAVDQALEEIDPERKHAVERLPGGSSNDVIALAKDPLALDTPRKESGRDLRPRFQWRWAAGFAAVVLAAAVLWTVMRSGEWEDFSTAVGEQRSVRLIDGSLVHLNTRSRVRVRMSNESRELRLLEGEALFKVAHEPGRPFRVRAGETLIQALGTQFDVYRRPNATTTVAVIEGMVRVTGNKGNLRLSTPRVAGRHTATLSAGEQASIAAGGEVRKKIAENPAGVLAWRQRRLVFRQHTLAEVIAEFNRYNHTPQFKLNDAAIAARHYSGEFDADDPESLTKLLGLDENLRLEKTGDEILIRGTR